jgi:4-hydroxybenzoate polyprenyltransferase
MREDPRPFPRASASIPATPPQPAPAALTAGSLLNQARYVLVSMRPRQWTKNLIVYMAFVFSINQEWEPHDASSWAPLLGKATLATLIFCLVSGADYLFNDVRDRESDHLHPVKRRRPVAAGLLSPNAAVAWAAVLALIGLGGSFALDLRAGGVVAGYIALMLAYSYHLKHMVLLDLGAIAAGFVLRAMVGALVIDVPISPWLYVVTALGALFLVINKRRAELLLLEEGANQHRATLEEYTPALLDQMSTVVTASTLVAYGLYTFTAENLPDNHAMMLTLPFVLYGIFRYFYLVHTRDEGGQPEEILLRDWPLIIDIALWLTTAIVVLLVYRD